MTGNKKEPDYGVVVSCRLGKKDHTKLKKLVKLMGGSKAALVLRAVKEFLSNHSA